MELQGYLYGKVYILTASRRKINEEINIMVDDKSLSIGVYEIDDEWFPFRPFTNKADSEVEDLKDDEFFSCQQEGLDLEEGEISSNGVLVGQAPLVVADIAPLIHEEDEVFHGN